MEAAAPQFILPAYETMFEADADALWSQVQSHVDDHLPLFADDELQLQLDWTRVSSIVQIQLDSSSHSDLRAMDA